MWWLGLKLMILIFLSFVSVLKFSKTMFGLLLSLEFFSFNLLVYVFFSYFSSTILCLTFMVCSSICGVCLILNNIMETNNSSSFSFIL